MLEFWNQLLLLLCNGSIVTAFFVVFLLNHKTVRRSRANLFLSTLLVALAFSIFHILYAGRVIRHFSDNMYAPGDPSFLLIAPLAWMYAVELTGQRIQFNWRIIVHFIPVLLIAFISVSANDPNSSWAVVIREHKLLLHIFFRILVVVQFLAYQYMINRKWLLHQHFLRQEVSNTENLNISWIKFFFIVFLVVNVFFLVSLFIDFHTPYHSMLPKATAFIFSMTVYALSFRGILQRDIFDTVKPSTIVPEEPKPESKPVQQHQATITKLVNFMEESKPYLDPELSLNTLANNLNLGRNQLSQLINEGLGQNFYDFINKYRVEEVKRLMADASMANYSLLGIAFEAGFKSKSTFNAIFKRFTGLTPTEYRKNLAG